ncbi:hypothetical protein NDU88_000641 [Pleurodeles waltl]|uniref:Uncharacterized protein n=1 Tax=Pleurodeles waltl TaxID=8319 RepID=A0AAV7LJ42_PLEWA|nr:hypothetical protein NDU88_000641 [Pleurodeles waltl]
MLQPRSFSERWSLGHPWQSARPVPVPSGLERRPSPASARAWHLQMADSVRLSRGCWMGTSELSAFSHSRQQCHPGAPFLQGASMGVEGTAGTACLLLSSVRLREGGRSAWQVGEGSRCCLYLKAVVV